MPYTPPIHIHSLVRFWWDAAGYVMQAARQRLDLGLTGLKPFLPRPDRDRLAAMLSFFEPIVRRALYLMAAEMGALPPTNVNGENGNSPKPTCNRSSLSPSRAPCFRLREGAGSHTSAPPPTVWRSGPRIRFLDEPSPVDLREYLLAPDDILPAGHLVRRLAAINHALDNPGLYIKRIRHFLGAQIPIISPKEPPAFRNRRLHHMQQNAARALHAETCLLTAPNTS